MFLEIPGKRTHDTGHRYAAVILNGVKNPFYKEALRDIVEAIIKQRAEKGKPAQYWGLEEQETRLIAAYDKWLKEGSVWSAAAPKVRLSLLYCLRHLHVTTLIGPCGTAASCA